MANKKVTSGRFTVNTEGFRDQMTGREAFRIIQELISNGFDEKTATKVNVKIKYVPRKKQTAVLVEDDGQGFERIEDVYQLFGRSQKVTNPELRGRFNLGEKQFFAMCSYGYIKTAGRLIEFKGDRRIEVEVKTEGTEIFGYLPFPKSQVEEAVRRLQRIIVPQNKTLAINGDPVPHRQAVRSFRSKLITLLPKPDSPHVLGEYVREAQIDLYPLEDKERAWLFEMGIPVQSINALWHVDIQQKIPLSPNRDTVKDAWLATLYGALVTNAHDLIQKEEAGRKFVTTGLEYADKDSARDILQKRYGTDQIYFESGNYRSNETALGHGAVVPSGTFDKDTIDHLQDLGIAEYASKAFPVGFADSETVKPDRHMQDFAKVVNEIAKDTIKKEVQCRFVKSPDASELANWDQSSATVTFNVSHLGRDFYIRSDVRLLGVVIHELAHDGTASVQYAHLSHDYIDKAIHIGAVIAMKGLEYYTKRAGIE